MTVTGDRPETAGTFGTLAPGRKPPVTGPVPMAESWGRGTVFGVMPLAGRLAARAELRGVAPVYGWQPPAVPGPTARANE